jgi:hypothetical protein
MPSTSLDVRYVVFPPSVKREPDPLPPTQVPFTAKQPDARLMPCENVLVAEPFR